MYDRQEYWSRVADEIAARQTGSDIAGNDTPAYRHKRAKVAEKVGAIDFRGKSVLEVGCGTGLNLQLIAAGGARSITAIDVSPSMIAIAKKRMAGTAGVKFLQVDGDSIPLDDRSVDCSITVTVLQHNTDPAAFQGLVKEICRVTASRVYLFEDTAPAERRHQNETFVAREPSAYARAFAKSGFALESREVIKTFVTMKLFSALSRITGLHQRHEGAGSVGATWLLPLTAALDHIVPIPEGNTMMVFARSQAADDDLSRLRRA